MKDDGRDDEFERSRSLIDLRSFFRVGVDEEQCWRWRTRVVSEVMVGENLFEEDEKE